MTVGPGRDGAPISFQEIEAWTRLTGIVLTSWEATALQSLSKAYMAEWFAASSPDRPPPYAYSGPVDREAVAASRKAQMERLEREDQRRR